MYLLILSPMVNTSSNSRCGHHTLSSLKLVWGQTSSTPKPRRRVESRTLDNRCTKRNTGIWVPMISCHHSFHTK